MATRTHWSSRFGFVLAAVGSAVGLGNIWKFPYITGVNGGGAFVLVYLLCIAVVGLPVLMAELYIGQKGQSNTVVSFEKCHKRGTPWRFAGWIGLASAFIILSYYSVIGGWVLDYVIKAITNQFHGSSEKEIQGFLGALLGSPGTLLFWHFIFTSLCVGIVVGGVSKGIERWARILMPAFFGLLLILLVHSMFLPGFGEALTFLFKPDTSKLTAEGVLEAVGHSFFTLSLGMGCMITYGSYLKKNESLTGIAIISGIMDTLVALIAGIVIFSIVFSHGLAAGAGPTLMFKTLPVLFAKIPGGYFIALAFFLLVGFAALTSAVSILEVVVAYLLELDKMGRKTTTIAAGTLSFLLGILTVFSFNIWSSFHIVGKLTFFDAFDKLTSNYMLPIGGFFISLFFGWVLGPKAVEATLGKKKDNLVFRVGLLWATRLVAPVAIGIMIFNALKG